ncbi:hypothetical protein MP228_002127 [Amoeboaphelidium protococcarum]|nr:hypothetical protein MP228_002127 [Amoeboaphelidium protococcarum]
MRSVLLKSPSGRNAAVHDHYPNKDILLNAYNCLVQNDKPDSDVALAFMKIIAR